ncbi:MAG: hypothetical protein ACI4OR_04550 [Alphaproteobacteria bacterium]
MKLIKLKKKKDRFEIYLFGSKIIFYRYFRILREIFLMVHYNQLKETLKTKFNITLPKEAYHHLSGDVELVEVPLKELRIPCGHRKTCTIPETSVYKFLESKGKMDYDYRLPDYYSEANVFIPAEKKDTLKRMENLVISLAEKYDPSKCAITVRKNNTVIDGQHRAAALYYKYGKEYKILVVRER